MSEPDDPPQQAPEEEPQAIALYYDGHSAPRVTAKGEGTLADEILRVARDHEVPVYENPELLELLASLELGDEIPETLYLAIAEIIAFVYRLKGKTPEGGAGGD